MPRSAVELDFFRMEKEEPLPKQPLNRRRSFRDIQSMVSKMNPDLLKTVIASGSVDQSFVNMAKPFENGNIFISKTLFSKHDDESNNISGTSPLTIFYNGAIAVFDVPPHMAQNILKLAEGKDSETVASSADQSQILNGDLPIARRKSLQRFLAKRQERMTLASPYGCPAPTNHAFSGQN